MTSSIPITISPRHPAHAAQQLEAERDQAFIRYVAVSEEYPGPEWHHVVHPLYVAWMDAERALAVSRFEVQA